MLKIAGGILIAILVLAMLPLLPALFGAVGSFILGLIGFSILVTIVAVLWPESKKAKRERLEEEERVAEVRRLEAIREKEAEAHTRKLEEAKQRKERAKHDKLVEEKRKRREESEEQFPRELRQYLTPFEQLCFASYIDSEGKKARALASQNLRDASRRIQAIQSGRIDNPEASRQEAMASEVKLLKTLFYKCCAIASPKVDNQAVLTGEETLIELGICDDFGNLLPEPLAALHKARRAASKTLPPGFKAAWEYLYSYKWELKRVLTDPEIDVGSLRTIFRNLCEADEILKRDEPTLLIEWGYQAHL